MNEPTLHPRLAHPDDYAHFVRLAHELGTGDPVSPVEPWTAEMMPTTLVFEDGDVVVGYAFVQPLARMGYVRHVVLAPTHRGRGLGLQIMMAAAGFLRARGCADWCLNVRPENTPAVRLYQGCGLLPRHTSQSIRIPWAIMDTLPREERRVAAQPIEAADDSGVEATFSLPEGQLANARARAGRLLLGLRTLDAPQAWTALAGFDPRFPGAFLFRAQHLSLAAPLLDAIRPHALPEHTHLRVMVEADEPLASLLLAHGGEIKHVTLHMTGPLHLVAAGSSQ